jgi:hypothetical protein
MLTENFADKFTDDSVASGTVTPTVTSLLFFSDRAK